MNKRANTTRRAGKTAGKRPRKPKAPAKTWQELFLAELRQCGNVRAACAKAHIERTAAYRARQGDEAFAASWKSAIEDAIDDLEAEAWHRARVGDVKFLFYQGEPIKINGKMVVERQKSDTLMALLLKAHRPEKYRERAESLNLNLDLANLTDEQLERISRGEDPRAVLAAPGESGTGAEAPAQRDGGDHAVEPASAEPTTAESI